MKIGTHLVDKLIAGTAGVLTVAVTAGITLGAYEWGRTEFIQKGTQQYCIRQDLNSITIWDGGYKLIADTNAVLQKVDYTQNLGRFGIKREVRKPNLNEQKLFTELMTTYVSDKKRDLNRLENLEKAISIKY